jgi:hypothetical protein
MWYDFVRFNEQSVQNFYTKHKNNLCFDRKMLQEGAVCFIGHKPFLKSHANQVYTLSGKGKKYQPIKALWPDTLK